MEREAVLVGIDVGTSKVCALMGEVSRDGRLTIMGHGTVPASGLRPLYLREAELRKSRQA